MLVDLHVQSNYSQKGSLDPEEVILKAKQVGLDGLCFVEDQPFAEWKELKELGAIHELVVLVGRKVKTTEGYFLYFSPKAKDVASKKMASVQEEPMLFSELEKEVAKSKGALVAIHPYDLRIDCPSGDRLFGLSSVSALETKNGRCKDLINDFAMEASGHLRIATVGGSETVTSLSNLGSTASLFLSSIQNEEELVQAILSKQVWPVELKKELSIQAPSQDSRYNSGGNRDNRGGDRDNRGGDRDNRGGNRDNRGGNRDNRGGSRDNRGGNRDNRGGNRDNRSERPPRKEYNRN